MSPRRVIALCLASLALAALLDAQGLRRSAETRPAGVGRTVATALTRPLAGISSALYLDRPRHALQVAIGRGGADRVDATVRLPVPTARHHARPPAAKHARRGHVRRPFFTRRHPLRIWVAGDSLAAVPGEALERAAPHGAPIDVLAIESRLSTGLSRPDLYNWFDRIPEAVRQLRPEVAVLSFGADDAHDYMSGVPQGRTTGGLGSKTWNAEYRRRVFGVIRELNAEGVYVVWLGLPIPRGPGFRRSFRVVNDVVRSAVAAARSRAAYVDTWSLLATKHGAYTDYLRDAHHRLVLMRAPDGVHYTQAAGTLVANVVLGDLSRRYDLRRPARP